VTGQQTQRERRAANRRSRMLQEYSQAQSEDERYRVMQRQFASAAAALRKHDPALADQLTREAAQALYRVAEQMLTYLAMDRRRGGS
jgi:hypothetical protein